MFWSSVTYVKTVHKHHQSPPEVLGCAAEALCPFPTQTTLSKMMSLSQLLQNSLARYKLLVQLCGAALQVLSEKSLLFSLIWPAGFVKEWRKLPVRTGNNSAVHQFLFSGGADEAFHSELSLSLLSRVHILHPYSLQNLLQEMCVASACPGLPEHRCTWQWI